MLAGAICLQLPFTPAQQFPKKIRETKTWIKVHTFNAQDTEGASALNRYLPKFLPDGSSAPAIAPSAGSKLQFIVSNLPSVLDDAIPPYKCICRILNATGADMHPMLVNGKQHMCTTNLDALPNKFSKLREVLKLPPRFRPNQKEHRLEQTLDEACKAWVNEVCKYNSELQHPATELAKLAATKVLQEMSMKGNTYQKSLPASWKNELEEFFDLGGVVSFGDKEPVHVIICQVLAVKLTEDMLSGSKRYIQTHLTQGDALSIMQVELNEAVGGNMSLGEHIPRLRQHVKTHKPREKGGMTMRPTTDSRERGCYRHGKMMNQILKLTIQWAEQQPNYTVVQSTTHFLQELPAKLPRIATADVKGFFTEISHDAIRKYMTILLKKTFHDYQGRHMFVTERSSAWTYGQADSTHPKQYDQEKVVKLIDTLLSNDYTITGGRVYVANEGVPMGASYSSHLASLTLWVLETLAIPILQDIHLKLNLGPAIYLRYVDDCIHTTPRNIFKAVMDPAFAKASCVYETDEDENEFTKGVTFLQAKIVLQRDGALVTSHYSQSYKINPNTPMLPTKGGASTQKTYSQAVKTYCRAAYTTSTTLHEYIRSVAKLVRSDIHPKYSRRSIARAATETLSLPDECRYGVVNKQNRHRLEQYIRESISK